MTTAKIDLEELLKPRIVTCGRCGGELHIIPYKEGTDKKFAIKTINICGKCTFEKGYMSNPG